MTDVVPKRKLRPARKQVKPGDIDKSEGPQPGKEYSEFSFPARIITLQLAANGGSIDLADAFLRHLV